MTYYSYIMIVCIAIVVGTLMSGGWKFRDQAPSSDTLGPNQVIVPTGQIVDPGLPTSTPMLSPVAPSPLPPVVTPTP
jgi:hypothetical protein